MKRVNEFEKKLTGLKNLNQEKNWTTTTIVVLACYNTKSLATYFNQGTRGELYKNSLFSKISDWIPSLPSKIHPIKPSPLLNWPYKHIFTLNKINFIIYRERTISGIILFIRIIFWLHVNHHVTYQYFHGILWTDQLCSVSNSFVWFIMYFWWYECSSG